MELSIEGAARLIAEQFEELASPRLERIGRGWDNDAYLVEGRFVFRFPRREIAVECMRNETRCLPMIADRLPLAIPRPTHVGQPAAGYPYPFLGYGWIAGKTACSVPLDDEDRRRCAGPLGRFLATLHGLPATEDAPADPAGDKDVAKLVEKTIAALEKFEDLLERDGPELLPLVAAARKTVKKLASTPDWRGEARWVHGDLYARHLLVDESKKLCGVIDWGDVHAGETADDLAIAFSFLRGEARRGFFEAYGKVDEATAGRARLYALHSGAVAARYGWEVGDRDLVEVGRVALESATQAE